MGIDGRGNEEQADKPEKFVTIFVSSDGGWQMKVGHQG